MNRGPHALNPFPGLRAFRADEDYLFFGREEQTLELLQRLGTSRFVAVVGTSGSGKSSLVRCGLLSELLGGKMLQAGASWHVAVTHPGGNPLGLLTDALLDAELYDREQENTREHLLATLSRSHFGLVEAVKQADLGEATNFLLVVDQFEEIFRFHEAGQVQQEAANEFVSLLLEAVAQKDVPIYVVLTMRSDFIGECGQFEGLAEMVNRGEFLIPRLSREQYKRIIEGPIKVAGGQITPRLLQRLLNDLGQQQDQLPCLQHALMRTWTVWSETGDREALDLDDYQRVGKMAEALSLHADEVYDALASDRQRELCRGMFQALTVQESEQRGIRRPQRLSALCQILEVEVDELLPIVEAFRQPGVTFLMPPPEVELTAQTIVDISHESLMRVWTRLRHWVEEEAQATGIYRRLSESAALFRQGKAGLYRDPELGIALAWRESKRPNRAWAERYLAGFAEAMDFLEASRQAAAAEEQAREAARQHELEQAQQLAEVQQLRLVQQHRAARRLRVMLGGLAVVALIALVAFGAALVANNRANRLAELASAARDRAQYNAAEARRGREAAQKAQRATEHALTQVESEKSRAESNLQKAEVAEQRSREFRYATDIQLAAQLIGDEHANAGQVLDRLADHDPEKNPDLKGKSDLRGFEWHYLKRLVDSRAAVFEGGDQPVVDCTLTAGGQLVTLDERGTLRRWDVETRRETAPAQEIRRAEGATSKALSPDGRLVALAAGSQVLVLDAATGKQAIRPVPAPAAFGLIFSPDNRMLVTVDQRIGWWHVATGKPIAVQESKLSVPGPVSISADGLTVAVGGQGGAYLHASFSVFRLNPQAHEVTVLLDKQAMDMGTTRTIALSPDGRSLAASQFFSGDVALFDTSTGRKLSDKSFEHAASVSAITFDPDGERMVTACLDGSIKIWAGYKSPKSSKTGAQETTALMGHREEIARVVFAPGGKRLLSASKDRTARIWELGQKGASLHRVVEGLNAERVTYSPDGLLIAGSEAGNIRLREAATGRLVREFPARADQTSPDSVAISPDNRLLAVGRGGKKDFSQVELWDIDTGQRLAVMPGTTDIPGFTTSEVNGILGTLKFSPDGKRLVAGFGSRHALTDGRRGRHPLKVYDVALRRTIHLLEGHQNSCISIAFSRDGSRMASGSYDGTARIWDTSTWKTLHALSNPDPLTEIGGGRVLDVAFSPAGDLLAMASHEGNVHVWNAATGEHVQTLRGHANGVSAVGFAPDGRTLASGSFDNTVRLWNVATWRELVRLAPGGAIVPRSLDFSPDGSQLVAGAGTVVLWSTRAEFESASERAAQRLSALLSSKADFTSRIRMLSEDLRLHEALDVLHRQRPDDVRLQAALAATRANWHASRQEWKQAVAAFDQLQAIPPHQPVAWFRTPALLRLANALLHENRPAEAAVLLTGGAPRRTEDGLPAAVDRADFGFASTTTDETVRVTELLPGFPQPRAGLRVGDIILKANDVALTGESQTKLGKLTAGEAGTKVRLTVRHAGSEQPEVIELTKSQYVHDPATSEQLHPLLAAINERLTQQPRSAGLLELRAELAGQWSGWKAQAADYSAAIEALSKQTPAAPAGDLQRLYRRRGKTYASSGNWKSAVADYARGIQSDAADDDLANATVAEAEALAAQDRETIVPTSEAEGVTWRFTTQKPAEGWNEAKFDDSGWDVGPAPFGSGGGTVRTSWSSPDIWLRHTFAGPPPADFKTLFVRIYVDDAAEIFLNGHRLASRDTWTERAYVFLDVATLPPGLFLAGPNTLAVHGRDTGGEVFVDVGLYAARKNARQFQRALEAKPSADLWLRVAADYRLRDDQASIDRLVERRPQLAGPIGDLFAADRQWKRAIEIYSKAVSADKPDVELLSKRARAYEAIEDWEAAWADWSRAAQGNPASAGLLAEFAGRTIAGTKPELAAKYRDRVKKRLEDALHAEPGNGLITAKLAQVLLETSPAGWTVLTPVEMKSKGGATLSKLADQSILAGGKNTFGDAYTIVAQANLPQVRAIRLEALTHESLPNQGPGRDEQKDRGSFDMTGFKISVRRAGKEPLPVEVSRKIADRDVADSSATHWNIGGGGAPRTAVYQVKQALEWDKDARLEFELQFSSNQEWPLQNLGRFRLSVSGDAAAFDREEKRLTAARTADPATLLAFAYAIEGEPAQAAQWLGRALEEAESDTASAAIVGKLQDRGEVLEAALKVRPRDSLLRIAVARSQAQRGRKELDQNRPAQALVELKQARQQFREVTGTRPGPQWTLLKPIEMKSQGGATLTALPDGSILAGGTNPPRDVYTLVAKTPLERITALRLEALPDPSLPHNGPGRFAGSPGGGNFHLNELRVLSKEVPVKLTDIIVDYDENDEYRHAIDGRVDSLMGWSDNPKSGEPNTAVIAMPLRRAVDDSLRIEMYFSRSFWTQHNLGRFRLSVTGNPDPIGELRPRKGLKDAELAELDVAVARAEALLGHATESATVLAQAIDRLESREDRKKLIDSLRELDALDALVKLRPQDLDLQLALARRHAERGQELLTGKRLDKALAELEQARRTYNPILAAHPQPKWTALVPIQMESAGGATLARQGDGSILAGGKSPERDTYTLTFQPNLPRVTAFRIETLPDDTLPFRGSGRSEENGNFALTGITIRRLPAPPDRTGEAIRIQAAWVDHNDPNNATDGVAGILDQDPETYWSVWPLQNQAHSAVLQLDKPVELSGAAELSVQLHFQSGYSRHAIGRFRLSATGDSETVLATRLRHVLATSGLPDLEIALGRAEAQAGRGADAAADFGQALDLAVDRATVSKVVSEAAAQAGMLEILAEQRAADARFQDLLARHYAGHGDLQAARGAVVKARASYEAKLAAEPRNSQPAQELADLLLGVDLTNWTVLAPTAMKSEAGAELTLEKDGSIYVGGTRKPKDVYVLEFPNSGQRLEAIRLEALRDDRLPNGGPGTDSSANFVLSDFKVFSGTQPVSLRAACATFEERRVHDSLTPGESGWSIAGGTGKSQVAYFAVEPGAATTGSQGLRILLDFSHEPADKTPATLGRFRLSSSADAGAFAREARRVQAIKMPSPWTRLAAAYGMLGEEARSRESYFRALDLAPDDAARAEVARLAAPSEQVFAALLERTPKAPFLRLGQTKYLAAQQIGDKQFEEALHVVAEALKAFPEDLDLLAWKAEAELKLGQWAAANADYSRLIERQTDGGKRRAAELARAEAQLRLGQCAEAAEVYSEEMFLSSSWDNFRNAMGAEMLAGHLEAARGAATRLFQALPGNLTDAYWANLLTSGCAAIPGMITTQNRDRLASAAQAAGKERTALLTAAIAYRLGNLKDAAPLLDPAGGDPLFLSLAAMLLYDQGDLTRARSFLRQADHWFEQQRGREPGGTIPASQSWQDWAVRMAVWREAARKLAGPRLTELDALLSKEPANASALLERASLLAEAGLHTEALADLNKAGEPKTDSAKDSGLRGRALAALNRTDAALPELSKAIDAKSTDPRVYAARGAILLKKGQTDQARSDLETSLDLDPSEQAAGLLGDLLWQARFADEKRSQVLESSNGWARLVAVEHRLDNDAQVDRLVQKHPAAAGPIADGYFHAQEWRRAIAFYDKILPADSKDAKLWSRRAEAYANLKDWEHADSDWKRALALSGGDETALRERWLAVLTTQKRWREIAREYNARLEQLPAGFASYNPRGQLLSAVVRRHDPVYQALLDLRPKDYLLPLSLARDSVLRSEWASAAKTYASVIDEVPLSESWYEYCAALLLADKPETYRDVLQRMATRAGEVDEPLLGFALARAAVLSPQSIVPPATVIGWATPAAEMTDAQAWHWHVAGLAHWRAGNSEKALTWLGKSAAREWHPELNQAALCLVYAGRGETDKARDYLRQVREWMKKIEAERKPDGYYEVQDTDWLEMNLLVREAEHLLK